MGRVSFCTVVPRYAVNIQRDACGLGKDKLNLKVWVGYRRCGQVGCRVNDEVLDQPSRVAGISEVPPYAVPILPMQNIVACRGCDRLRLGYLLTTIGYIVNPIQCQRLKLDILPTGRVKPFHHRATVEDRPGVQGKPIGSHLPLPRAGVCRPGGVYLSAGLRPIMQRINGSNISLRTIAIIKLNIISASTQYSFARVLISDQTGMISHLWPRFASALPNLRPSNKGLAKISLLAMRAGG